MYIHICDLLLFEPSLTNMQVCKFIINKYLNRFKPETYGKTCILFVINT